jgi:hypothetical protein
MPADALPVPWAEPVPGAVTYRREYRDLLGRPLRGTVTITATTRADVDGHAVVAAPVSVELAGGVLAVSLLPGAYTLAADLRTAEGVRVADTAFVSI